MNTGEKGLKNDAIGFGAGLTIALAPTAPAYSLAAVIGSIAVIVGFQAPAALLLSFVPMFFIATAFYYMNRADQECGTSFSWVTRAIGPQAGWITGWTICVTGILVIGSLADVAAYSFFEPIGAESLVESKLAVTGLALALIAVMTTICVLSALALMIAFYYAFTGIACAVYYRRELRKSVKNLLVAGLAPVIGAVLLGYLFFKALIDYADPANSYTGSSWFGVAPPAAIGVGFLVGFLLLAAWRRHQREPFLLRRREVAPPGLLEGELPVGMKPEPVGAE